MIKHFDDNDDEHNKVVPDGGRIRVGVLAMDAIQRQISSGAAVVDHMGRPAGNRPGYLFSRDNTTAANKASDEAYREHCRLLSDGWRATPRAPDDTLTSDLAPKESAADPYEEYKTWLTNAWRGK
jgi:hypothetical protein